MPWALRFRRPALWLAAGAAVHLVYVGSLYTGWLNLLFNDSSHTQQGFDFAVYYMAGQALRHGADVYGLDAAFGFRYLPAFAYTFCLLFSAFTPRTGYLLYLICTELVLAVDLYLTWRLTQEEPRRSRCLFMWLASSPLYLELYMGQISFWAASLVFWGLCAAQRAPGWREDLAWTCSALLKPNTLILAPVYLRLRRFRPLALALLAVVLSSAPYFLLYPGSWGAFLEHNFGGAHVPGALTHAGNLGLWGALVGMSAKLAGLPLAGLSELGELPLWSRLVLLLVVAAVLAASLVTTFLCPTDDRLALAALWLATYFLVYKDVWEHHYVFLLPALVLLYLRSPSPVLLAIFALVALPTPFALLDVSPGTYGNIDPERSWGLATSVFYRSCKLLPSIGLWGWLLHGLWASQGDADRAATRSPLSP